MGLDVKARVSAPQVDETSGSKSLEIKQHAASEQNLEGEEVEGSSKTKESANKKKDKTKAENQEGVKEEVKVAERELKDLDHNRATKEIEMSEYEKYAKYAYTSKRVINPNGNGYEAYGEDWFG